ncbi:uncharacterized protein LOC143475284 [Brachyhypopomus gauderio]|uniref:uncharacterized protein LOC143475284 n=1 Tax=Brachyhypopomus gauderio TaxID=698409 RepID=UPI0040410FC8
MALLVILLTVASSVIWAKEYYYPQNISRTWDEARKSCQSCFKDLVIITIENAQSIVHNLTSDYWIGLRQSFNGSRPWSQWANGDPFSFQNWYPGRPVLKKPVVPVPTCPTPTTTPTTTLTSTYSLPHSPTHSSTHSLAYYATDSSTDFSTDSTTDSTTDSARNSTSTSTPTISTTVNEMMHCPALTKLLSCLNSSDFTITEKSLNAVSHNQTNSASGYTGGPTSLIDTEVSSTIVNTTDSYSSSFIDTTSYNNSSHPREVYETTANTTDSYSSSFIATTSYNNSSHPREVYDTNVNTTDSYISSFKDTTRSDHSSHLPEVYNTTVSMTDSYSNSVASTVPKSLETSHDVTSSHTISTEHSTTTPSTVLTQASVSTISNSIKSTVYQNSTSVPTKPHTTEGISTSPTVSSTVASSPVTIEANDTDPNAYIEDSCVVLLSFGMWWEKHCNDVLRYICYDELFYGTLVVNNTTDTTVSVSWKEAAGNITHYRVKLSRQDVQIINGTYLNETNLNHTRNVTGLETEFNDLEPGTLYQIQMIPVKCGRDLNPDTLSFYTLPESISNLTIVNVEMHNVTLNWTAPYGGYDSYLVNVSGKPHGPDDSYYVSGNQSDHKSHTVVKLHPGVLYNFTVCAVLNNSVYGQAAWINGYTKPSPVKNLTSANNDTTKITVSWDSDDCNSTEYCYHIILYENEINKADYRKQTITLTNLTAGSKYTLSVSALANCSVEGEALNISAYTSPLPVSNLNLKRTNNSITASWQNPGGNYTRFEVNIFNSTNNIIPLTTINTNQSSYMFDGLKAAEKYTVSVISYLTVEGMQSFIMKSDAVNATNYTLPVPLVDVSVISKNTTTVQLKWVVPDESKGVTNMKFKLTYSSPFWMKNGTFNVTGQVTTIIPDLQSGSRYYFNVSILAGDLESAPVSTNEKTVANNRTLTLSVLCSSAITQYCMREDTISQALNALKQQIDNHFSQKVFWTLERKAQP